MAARALELSSVRRAVSSAMGRRSRESNYSKVAMQFPEAAARVASSCAPTRVAAGGPSPAAVWARGVARAPPGGMRKRLEWRGGRGAAHSRLLDPVGISAARLRSDDRPDAERDLERPAAQRARGGGDEPSRLPGVAGPGAGAADQPALAAVGADGRGGGCCGAGPSSRFAGR